MPEIKNQIKNDPAAAALTPETPHNRLFDPPQRRRGYLKYLITLLVLIVLAGGGYFAYAQYMQPSPAPVVTTPPVPEEKVIPEGTNFYLASDSDNTEARIYRYSEESSKPDEKIGTIPQKNISVVGDYTKPYTYVTSNAEGNKLQTLDATTAKLEPLFDLPEKAVVREVAVSNDKKYLAYGRTYGYVSDQITTSEVWLYNIETKEQKQLGETTKLGLYQGFSVLGWRDNDSQLIISALGGDAGAVWGEIYKVDIATGKFTKLPNPDDKNVRSFLTGKLSPNGDQWLYEFCAEPDDAIRTAEDNRNVDACTSGIELRTYDLSTEQVKTVYQNLRYENNADKSSLRTFMSYVWQDDKTIVASAPGALLSIPIGNPEKTSEILTYDRGRPQAFQDNGVYLDSATPAAVVFTRNDSWSVFDRVSQKLVDINISDRKEQITAWLN